MNLVFMAVDTLRSDHLSSYGYQKSTSPHIDRLAESGTLFENFYSVGNCTQPGFTAMLTGLVPESTGIVSHWTMVDPRENVLMLAERFARAGFQTAAVDNLFHGWAAHGSREYPWFRRGYGMYMYPEPVAFDIPAEHCLELAFQWLEKLAKHPFFFFIHLWDPHGPYNRAPAHFYKFYDGDDPCDPRLDFLPPRIKLAVQKTYGLPVTDPNFVIAAYDAEIAYTDHCVGRLVVTIVELGMYDNTVFCLTSDHGEILLPTRTAAGRPWAFGHIGLNQETLRVPLVLSRGSVAAGNRVSARAQLVDIVPSLVELFGLTPEGEMDGRSLAPALRGHTLEEPEFLCFSENTYQKQRAILHGEWKYMRMETNSLSMPAASLYHLGSDPGEYENLADSFPEKARELACALDEYVTATTNGRPDPLKEQAITRPVKPGVSL